MLERLRITNFAVARSVELCPGPGLNVFTGETGAGKSLVVDALAFLFGARRSREIIASGAVRASVEAEVVIDGERRVVERSISAAGRSSAWLDGGPATLDGLQALGGAAIDIHGQSEQLAILRPGVQLSLLDGFAGLAAQREDVTRLVRALRETRRRMAALTTDARERERLLAQLRFEADEIEAAALEQGEDEALRGEQQRLTGVARLREDVAAAVEGLDGPGLADTARAVNDLVGRDGSATQVADALALYEAGADDLRRALRGYAETLEEDPERLANVEERLDLIARLRRKYGEALADVITYGREARERLEAIESSEGSIEELSGREEALLAALGEEATRLSLARRLNASALAEAIRVELGELGMGDATLAVGFACDDDAAGPLVAVPDYGVVGPDAALAAAAAGEAVARGFTEAGVDRVEFLASFNPGEPARPLASVASGGETSRFLLALTTVLGSAADPRIVVFDEVDEGVGGRAGTLVGEALSRLAARHQVLCITHLPQVAAYGDRHFVVTKETDGRSTWSEVRTVEGEERVDELAAMLGAVTETNRAAARALLPERGG